ncbi:restriction endonuclease subunit S [Haemophilus haemolyticus]|uniref:Restriction endonuclease subunit S n=1 Tax=Haemophilus haemolyticus TaxID=726 RepID=A0A502LFN2_HAEHA|nr:restriction endonuclease subunit S [Haemophilus haemolyticus]TPH21045.1 restriction endonuclease subunit S [Haemophilus haemolyticus]
MNRYERYKDSGIPWLGEVPEHWNIVGISKLFMLKAGGDLQPDFFSREKDDEHCYPIYTNANDEHAVYGYTSKKRFNADSITVSGRGDIGFAVYRDHDFDAIIRLLVLSPLKKLDCKYYTYSINALLDFKFESSAVAQLSTVQLAQYKLLLPDYDEQTAIAHYLDTKLGEIDALIDKQQTLLEKLAEQRTAVITHAVTKGLNPTTPMKKSGVEWLGDVPAHWNWIKLGYTLLNLRTGLNPRSNFELNTSDAENYYITIQELVNERIEVTEKTDKINDEALKMINDRSQLKVGDILLSGTGSIGKTALISKTPVNWNIKEGVYALTTNSNLITSNFLLKVFQSKFILNQMDMLAMGSTVRSVKMADLRLIKIPLPSLVEQAEITDYLDQETAKIDRLCETVNQTIGRLKEYRTALITQAVTGKIKVTDE